MIRVAGSQPAAPPPRRAQRRDHPDHEGEPADAADPPGRAGGAGVARPGAHGGERVVAVGPE